jgi:uncharacterized protein
MSIIAKSEIKNEEIRCPEYTETLETDSILEEYIDYFERKWGNLKPFVKLFQTEFGNYLYDPGTNKLLKCNDLVYSVIQQFQINDIRHAIVYLFSTFKKDLLLEGFREITDAIENQNIFRSDPEKIYFDSLHFSNLENEINENLGQLILEITEDCNLRCGYCIYNDMVEDARNHGNEEMELSIAYKAIDFIGSHSLKNETPAITFYGGEPLLRFSFIQKCVEYSHKVFEGKNVGFAITTNGTTVTPEIARFLARENFGVTLSIDGPKEIHNDYRVFRNGIGTFESAMKGLKNLVEAYGEEAEKLINLSMVYTPPFSSRRLDQIASLWEDYPWIGNIPAGITYPHEGSIPQERIVTKDYLTENKSMLQWAIDSYFESYSHEEQINPLVKSIIDAFLVKIFMRPIFDMPVYNIHLNGCCVPGARKIHVSTDGYISVCERVNNASPYLGHIDKGIDLNTVKRVYIEEYAEKSLIQCANCWAHRLCTICYTDTFSNRKYDAKRKAEICETVRNNTVEQLKLYSRLLSINPEGLNYLADIVVK